MREFFRPWQRKIGTLMLMMACVFSAGWVRSLTIADTVGFGEPSMYLALVSTRAEIRFARLSPGLNRIGFEWSSSPLEEDMDFRWQEDQIEWRYAFCGFDFASGASAILPNHHTARWVIPYWFVTVALTALSAFLLLSKPRQSNQKKVSEPIGIQGATS